MKQLFTICLLLFCMSYIALAQSYYYGDDSKIALEVNQKSYIVFTHSEQSLELLARSPKFIPGVQSLEIYPHKKYAVIQTQDGLAQAADAISMLGLEYDAIDAAPAMVLDDGFIMYPTHTVVYKPTRSDALQEIQTILDKAPHASVIERYGVYRVSFKSIIDVLPIANELYESGLVEFSHPDFYAELTHYSDPLYPDQFQMNNTGQTIDGYVGVNDMDCNAAEAWGISLGSSSITVAVIDDGLEDHEDLETSGGASRYINGYSPANNGNGDAVSGSNHGLACAGIIAASHNTIGVRGVAPLVDLLSVNIFVGGESTQDIADGITWAKDNGADVLSNSWGYTSCTAYYSNIANAITDANNNGRNGKGCMVIFASGNGSKSCVDFPANVSTAIAVGAFTNQGNRSSYSNYGADLDIMAPSNAVSPQPGAGVRTTDRMGSAGYSSGNYTGGFGGTSAACPVVAGVSALVLGYNDALSSTELRDILYNTAIDMGPSGIDTEYANGRVNAQAALQSAGAGSGSSCSDGVQNGDETGVDCGGPDCAPCSSGCQENELTLTIITDDYPGETTWELRNDAGSVVASGGPYAQSGTTYTEDICAADDCYDFTIFDSYGDGICCSYGNGSYLLVDGTTTLASGGSFGTEETTNFCIGSSSGPSCDDGIQNGDETGIDCGGSTCPDCPSGDATVLAHFFESGWDGWADGGSDCYRYSGSRSYEGNWSIRLRDNSGTRSAMTSSSYDLSGYSSIEIEFYFYSYSMENGEDFWVRFYNGSSWQTVATYARGTNFENNTFYVARVTLDASSYNLASNSRFRFQCDASANQDHIYIDAVTVTGFGVSQNGTSHSDPIALAGVIAPDKYSQIGSEEDLTLFPNPASELVTITATEIINELSLVSLSGEVLSTVNADSRTVQLRVADQLPGTYIVQVTTTEDTYAQTLVIF